MKRMNFQSSARDARPEKVTYLAKQDFVASISVICAVLQSG
jgi:hypothetical protein